MKKLLLTGFEPFLDYTVNPTMKIVEELDGENIAGYQIVGKVLPVDFNQSGKLFLSYIEEVKPEAAVSLGLAAGRYKITPERIAINFKDGAPDNKGHKPVDEPIEKAGEPAYLSTLPIRKMVERLIQNGLPAEISNTAGAYLCNNIMYEGLHLASVKQLNMPTGFIHIPASHELGIQHGSIPSWPHSDLAKGIRLCIEAMAAE
ncbi:Pyrrolidone-carboxylate peptidase [Planococcus massiliensis]|uniref:Pyrrolidone-carboxylate peptidase n=1 Tax=Planococcus massiliensis TaxID=1499687 RepID=A0A098ELM8_9BACL|nr:pyroglutamyl-peptidase I [Planococcus massiliensis]CEG22176.1 Pyrrolidone-carboxylate peptidase [Planococcus massiliensis]